MLAGVILLSLTNMLVLSGAIDAHRAFYVILALVAILSFVSPFMVVRNVSDIIRSIDSRQISSIMGLFGSFESLSEGLILLLVGLMISATGFTMASLAVITLNLFALFFFYHHRNVLKPSPEEEQ